jgi:hypothetical protein
MKPLVIGRLADAKLAAHPADAPAFFLMEILDR